MPSMLLRLVIVAAAFLVAPPAAHGTGAGEPLTVCTITVNSDDEWRAMRDRLPSSRYRFVELVDAGRDDWLKSSCERAIACDVLVVSGHFNAGDTFYSDRVGNGAHLRIDELERASCSGGCPALFSRLKEVYLFGCESLNPDARRYASSEGESGLARMRRIFSGVPAIYGFAGTAPVGPVAASLLHRHLDAPAAALGSGRVSASLLAAFARHHMTATSGVGTSGAAAQSRRELCHFRDDRLGAPERLALIHRSMRDGVAATGEFERIERLFAAFTAAERDAPGFVEAFAALSADAATRGAFLAVARAQADVSSGLRMIDFAGQVGWLDPAGRDRELVQLIDGLLARPALGFAEVGLACSIAGGHDLSGALADPRAAISAAGQVARAAVRACAGNVAARQRVMAALASPDEQVGQVAHSWLRERPMSDVAEVRALAREVIAMAPTRARVRALDALGRLVLTDGETLRALRDAFAAGSLESQRAIAEIFMRNAPAEADRAALLATVRGTRKLSSGGDDVIDALIRSLSTGRVAVAL